MQADVIYALPLRQPLEETGKEWPAEVLAKELTYGGGNNDGAAFLGVKLTTLAEGYEVVGVPLSDLVEGLPAHHAATRDMDAWWSQQSAEIRALCTAPSPQWLLVLDSE